MKKKQTLRGVSKLGLTRRDKKNSCHDIPLSSTLGKKKKTKVGKEENY
jgi:hypothetical protein